MYAYGIYVKGRGDKRGNIKGHNYDAYMRMI